MDLKGIQKFFFGIFESRKSKTVSIKYRVNRGTIV